MRRRTPWNSFSAAIDGLDRHARVARGEHGGQRVLGVVPSEHRPLHFADARDCLA